MADENLSQKLVKGGVKGLAGGVFLGTLGYVIGAATSSFVPGISAAVVATLGLLAGLLYGLSEAF
jgi:hypothetical protein